MVIPQKYNNPGRKQTYALPVGDGGVPPTLTSTILFTKKSINSVEWVGGYNSKNKDGRGCFL